MRWLSPTKIVNFRLEWQRQTATSKRKQTRTVHTVKTRLGFLAGALFNGTENLLDIIKTARGQDLRHLRSTSKALQRPRGCLRGANTHLQPPSLFLLLSLCNAFNGSMSITSSGVVTAVEAQAKKNTCSLFTKLPLFGPDATEYEALSHRRLIKLDLIYWNYSFLVRFGHFSEQEPVLLVQQSPHMLILSPMTLNYSAAAESNQVERKRALWCWVPPPQTIPKAPPERCKHQNKAFPRSFRQAAETPARSLGPPASIIGSTSLALDFNKPIVVSALVHFIVTLLFLFFIFFPLEVDSRNGQLVITAQAVKHLKKKRNVWFYRVWGC